MRGHTLKIPKRVKESIDAGIGAKHPVDMKNSEERNCLCSKQGRGSPKYPCRMETGEKRMADPDCPDSPHWRRILIIADIEGSSRCSNRNAAAFLTREWALACRGMTLDVAAVVNALFHAGVEEIRVKDFHRTAWNLFPEEIPAKARVIRGYRPGPVPGIGDPGAAEAVMFLGMHAASGTDGFLAHTLTSRISSILVNGRLLSEVELFAAALAPYGVRPIFFSGCPVACRNAEEAVHGIQTFTFPKAAPPPDVSAWRRGLAEAAVAALSNLRTSPFQPPGPVHAAVTLRDGPNAARKAALRWGFHFEGGRILLRAQEMNQLYLQLIRLCYLTPVIEKILPWALPAYNLWGRLGCLWARRVSTRSEAPPR
ncbi:conserved hypothetical protein [uncultured Desulfatiglans sp.]|uniref:D-aminopeptidase n=1 Tax=Uncultured Desulfatiglans sp. TaxID=1748965 RepID=A0A653AIC0_UNCDX|nr:conserved hypothetical protein [uncultured Desulfatiglans sp.]